jgi:anti-sigma regulatory factor (Ser/Thr protein kinase)
MTGDTVMKQAKLALPMLPDAEIEASKIAMEFAESMEMSPDRIDEVGAAVVEACINALEHSQSSEPVSVTFEVLGDQDPEKLRITVHDSGVGFSVEDAEKPKGGTKWPRGHGLKIIRGLMDEVEIRSHPGEGTTLVMSKMR